MAFYLSQRGDSSIRSALAVGSAVTAAHTGSVLLLGLLVSLSSAFVPARLYPWLTLATGLLIVGLGLYLLARLRSDPRRTATGTATATAMGMATGMATVTDVAEHACPRAARTSTAPALEPHGSVAVVAPATTAEPRQPPSTPGRWGVWVMGLVGGLVPSPSALLLLLAAVALGRAWFGFALVVAFGIGMAVSLAAVGLWRATSCCAWRTWPNAAASSAATCAPSCATAPRSASVPSGPASSSARSSSSETRTTLVARIPNPVTGFAPN